jgi:hypothetical protein
MTATSPSYKVSAATLILSVEAVNPAETSDPPKDLSFDADLNLNLDW